MPEANPSGKTKQNQKRKKWFLPVNKPSPKKPKETTPQTGSCNESTGTCVSVVVDDDDDGRTRTRTQVQQEETTPTIC